jgi:SSS family solute:Na+ symporter
MFSRNGGHVVEIGLSIASVLWGAMLGVFLLGTLSRRATENGAITGMVAGVTVNLLLWIQPRWLAFIWIGHPLGVPKIAWTWWVLIGSLVTCAVGYTASFVFPGQSVSEVRSR